VFSILGALQTSGSLVRAAQKTPDLVVDFPNTAKRFSGWLSCLRAVRRVMANPEIDAFTIRADENRRMYHEGDLARNESLAGRGRPLYEGIPSITRELTSILHTNITDGVGVAVHNLEIN
jgi:hypothetical protein